MYDARTVVYRLNNSSLIAPDRFERDLVCVHW